MARKLTKDEAVDLAARDAARRAGVGPEAVRVTSTDSVDFPNSALGAPRPGEMSADMMTPGWAIRVEAGSLYPALHRVRHDLGGDVDGYVGGAGRLQRLDHLAPDGLVLGAARVAQLDIERDVAVRGLDVTQRAARHEILAGIRIDQRAQRFLHLRFSEGHG